MRRLRNTFANSAVLTSIVSTAFLYALFFYKIQGTSCLWDLADSWKIASFIIVSTLTLFLPLVIAINLFFGGRRFSLGIETAAAFAMTAYILLSWFTQDKTLVIETVSGAVAAGFLFSFVLPSPDSPSKRFGFFPTILISAALGFPLLVHLEHNFQSAGAKFFFIALFVVASFVWLFKLFRLLVLLTFLTAVFGFFTLWQNTHFPKSFPIVKFGDRNLVLITIDALRADAIEPYNPNYKTPAFSLLANRSIVFDRAYSSTPWTMPSLASMFSGLNPRAHGCMEPDRCLANEVNNLAEILNARGFKAMAIIYQKLFEAHTGFEKEFKKYSLITCHPVKLYQDYFAPISKYVEKLFGGFPLMTELTTIEALRTLNAQNSPFFLWIHYLDPHGPYTPPKKFLELVKKPPEPTNLPGHATGYPETINPEILQMLQKNSPPPKPYETEYVRDMYQAEVFFIDEQLDLILKSLESTGLASFTYLIVTSDHGEEFYEHKGWDHGHTLYSEVLKVPLMISGPKIAQSRIECLTTSPDIFATVLALVDIPPPIICHGKNLLKVAQQQSCPSEELTFSTAFAELIERDAILSWPYKLIYPPMELYRVDEDPSEKNEISAQNIDLALELKWKLQQKVAADYRIFKRLGIKPVPSDAKKLQHELLKSLGYVQ